jgi:hypothetical protein
LILRKDQFLLIFQKQGFHYVLCRSLVRPVNPLKTQLNPIGHLLALLGAHRVLHVSRIRVNQFGQSGGAKVLFSQPGIESWILSI